MGTESVRIRDSVCAVVFLSPLRGLLPFLLGTHGLRRGLHSIAASRLESRYPNSLKFTKQELV